MQSRFYKGWLLVAPIWFRPADNMVKARWPWLEWWLSLNEILMGCCITLLSALRPDWEPVFVFKITDPDWREEFDR